MIRLLRKLWAPDARREAAAHRAVAPGARDRDGILAEVSALRAAGRTRDALEVVVGALEGAGADVQLRLAQAELLLDRERAREALDALARMETSAVRPARADCCAASAHLRCADAAAAEASFRSALVAEPGSADASFGLGMALFAQRRFGEAVECFREGHEGAPGATAPLEMLGRSLLEAHDPVAAESALRLAVHRDEASSATWRYLAAALDRQDRGDEALAAWEHATVLEDAAGDGESFVSLAVALSNRGRIADAIALLEHWLPRVPLVDGHFAYAIALLTAGRLPEGWDHYEFRWLREPLLSTRADSRIPAWTGQDLQGKTVLLRIEQGFGDTFQFLRYAPLVRSLGARVLLRRFDDVVAGVPGVELLDDTAAPPAWDYNANLLSLPRIFATSLGSIPADCPYLAVPSDRMSDWAKCLDTGSGGLRVGLVWGGGAGHARDRLRSIAPERFAALGTVGGIRYFSLQKDATTVPAGVVDLGPALRDFADTAAVVAQLDLVICVDTSVAHLAGALGKPVWVLLPAPADWRWLEDREDSPWYPTMRLFRQRVPGDWDDVLARVRQALDALVAGRVPAALSPRAAAADNWSKPSIGPTPMPGHRPGMSAVAQTRYGILQYLPDTPDEGNALAWYGEWLQSQLGLLERLMRPGSTVLEAGAGIGAHAVWLGSRLGPDGHLIASEARSRERRILRQNLAANAVRNVTILGDELCPSGGDAETVDSLHLARLDWLKLSGSSSVTGVLEGAGDTLWRHRPKVFAALAPDSAFDLLRGHGYRCWRHAAPLYSPANFNRRDVDLFAGRGALALLAIPEEQEVGVALDDCEEVR